MDTTLPAVAGFPADPASAQPPSPADAGFAAQSDSAPPARIPAPPAPVPACANCGAALTGRFCAECGQAQVQGRLNVRRVATETVASAADMDRGLLHTVAGLTLRPGDVVRDYLEGRTLRWTGPAKYFILVMAAVVLVYVQLGGGERLAALTGAPPGSEGVVRFMQTHMNLLAAAGVPFSALGTRLVYRRFGLNYAEHIVLNLYLNAHHILLMVPLSIGGAFGGIRALLYVNTVAGFAYLVWAARGIFCMGTVAAFLHTLGAQVITMLCGTLTGVLAGVVVSLLTR